MTKAPGSLQELRRRIYRKAKSETAHRSWGLFVHITKIETLEEAYRIAKGSRGDRMLGPYGHRATALERNERGTHAQCGTHHIRRRSGRREPARRRG